MKFEQVNIFKKGEKYCIVYEIKDAPDKKIPIYSNIESTVYMNLKGKLFITSSYYAEDYISDDGKTLFNDIWFNIIKEEKLEDLKNKEYLEGINLEIDLGIEIEHSVSEGGYFIIENPDDLKRFILDMYQGDIELFYDDYIIPRHKTYPFIISYSM